jgi:hypothetical protein
MALRSRVRARNASVVICCFIKHPSRLASRCLKIVYLDCRRLGAVVYSLSPYSIHQLIRFLNTRILTYVRCIGIHSIVGRAKQVMMFSYIASILGFQGQPNSTSNEPLTRSSISCHGYGWTVPSTEIRLQVSSTNSSEVHIFGFPPQEDFPKAMRYPPSTFGTDGPYIHYVLGNSPASVNYIMGDDWRSKLQSDPSDSSRGDIIFRPSVAHNSTCDPSPSPKDDAAVLEEERSHSLRMRRCGAVAVFSQEDIRNHDDRQRRPSPDYPNYLLGWPKSGGVWGLRSLWADPPAEPLGGYSEDPEERLKEAHKQDARDAVYNALAAKTHRQETMEEVCQVLEEGGARFYANVEDSPEAVELNLI